MQEQEAPMGRDFGVAMGDHVFFRWHDFVNSIYLTYKHSLPSYTEDEVSATVGIRVQRLQHAYHVPSSSRTQRG